DKNIPSKIMHQPLIIHKDSQDLIPIYHQLTIPQFKRAIQSNSRHRPNRSPPWGSTTCKKEGGGEPPHASTSSSTHTTCNNHKITQQSPFPPPMSINISPSGCKSRQRKQYSA